MIQLLIIGSGPAGYTASIYASRAGLQPVLYQGSQPGGQLTLTSEVENYPGYTNGVLGPQMMDDFQQQAQRFGAIIRDGNITSVDFNKWPFRATIDEKTALEAATVIIATGASAKWLGLESETRLNGKGVSACAVCDGFFFRKKDVAVVGGGDTAAEEALFLSKLVNKVYLIVRKDHLRASKFMQKRLKDTENITTLWNTEVQEILGDTEVTGLTIWNNNRKETDELTLQGIFVAIGHQPNTQLFKNFLDMDPQGYIKTAAGSTKTNIPGVFATGDVQDKIYRQAITAAGSGCMGALDAERWLATKDISE